MKNCLLSGLTKWIIRGSSSCCLAILVACTPAKVQLNVVPLPNDGNKDRLFRGR
jgi:hexosaminidase